MNLRSVCANFICRTPISNRLSEMVQQNTALTERVETLLKQNTELTQTVRTLVERVEAMTSEVHARMTPAARG
jgi:chaperonin cofactor prefoldin